jgi:phosphoribosylanthranilate isomerase
MKTVRIFATKVAVTSAHDSKSVIKVCYKLNPNTLQLHQHSPELAKLIRRRYPETKLILATAIRDSSAVNRAKQTARYSDAVLADTPSATGMGGTGRTHDWGLTASLRNRIYPHPLILAGGLTPSNVRLAIRKVRPFAVDVSSGVEKAIGVKDHDKIREFIINAKESVT